jgi:hypothetical protein
VSSSELIPVARICRDGSPIDEAGGHKARSYAQERSDQRRAEATVFTACCNRPEVV